ncbi:hypothetical protein EDC04DRAFT_2609875 [Pisolithus marmoratus]|nr:hypothetical protein EDC04DRAFT_2609875 [Pisolithus marmoratus]
MSKYDKGKAFEVSYMLWEDFRDTILFPKVHGEQWNHLVEQDCIIGWINYCAEHRSPDNAYQSYMELLASQVQIWPLIPHLKMAGDKWNTQHHLHFVALKLQTFSPETAMLHIGEHITTQSVLKWSNSECGEHVIFPGDDSQRQWTYFQCHMSPDEHWISQEYVKSLHNLGEWRVFIIGGVISFVIHTHWLQGWDWEGSRVESYLTLEEIWQLQYMVQRPSQQSWCSHGIDIPRNEVSEEAKLPWVDLQNKIINPEYGTEVIQTLGREEFNTFVLSTWWELSLRETRRSGGKSYICTFCRIDVGIQMMKGRRPSYFVNEVE